MDVNIFDALKSPNCVLMNPKTTILAIIGAQLMHSFNRNSPLWAPLTGEVMVKEEKGWKKGRT